MGGSAAEVRGKVLIGLIRYVESAGMEGFAPRIFERVPEVEAAHRKGFERVLWYPFSYFIDLLDATVEIAYDGRDAGYVHYGRWAARSDMRDYRHIVAAPWHPQELISMSDFVWRDNHRRAGRVEINPISTGICDTVIHRFEEMRHGVCLMMEGWSDTFSRRILDNYAITTRLTACHHSGHNLGAIYRSHWTPREMEEDATPS